MIKLRQEKIMQEMNEKMRQGQLYLPQNDEENQKK